MCQIKLWLLKNNFLFICYDACVTHQTPLCGILKINIYSYNNIVTTIDTEKSIIFTIFFNIFRKNLFLFSNKYRFKCQQENQNLYEN